MFVFWSSSHSLPVKSSKGTEKRQKQIKGFARGPRQALRPKSARVESMGSGVRLPELRSWQDHNDLCDLRKMNSKAAHSLSFLICKVGEIVAPT